MKTIFTTTRKTSPSRARITEIDANLLHFLAKFPAADAQSLTYLNYRNSGPKNVGDHCFPGRDAVERRLRKLEKLGAINRFRNPITGTTHYGVTPLGAEAAAFYGHEVGTWGSIKGLAISRLEHYRSVALVAAQLISPSQVVASKLGVEPLSIYQIVGERELRQPYDEAMQIIKIGKDRGTHSGLFTDYRRDLLATAIEQVKQHVIAPHELVSTYPALLTAGRAPTESNPTKPIHQPDLAIICDTQETRNLHQSKARNILVEVELSAKSAKEYEEILRTLKSEFRQQFAYERGVYFTNSKAIANLIRKVDRTVGTNLIADKLLTIEPIDTSNNTVFGVPRRVQITPHPAATNIVPITEEPMPRLS